MRNNRTYKQPPPVERINSLHPAGEKLQPEPDRSSEYVDFVEEADMKPEPAPRDLESNKTISNDYLNQ